MHGTDAVVDACRRLVAAGGKPPRVVFTSSVASFSATQADTLPDSAKQVPGNSHGAQKAAAELILADASRRGFMDVVSVRLPTVVVRPGRPNKAASSFFSGIIREPLAGKEAVLPVADTVRQWHASPRSAVGFLLRAAAMATDTLGPRRALDMPGVSATVGEQIAALGRVAGPKAVALIRREPATKKTPRVARFGVGRRGFTNVLRPPGSPKSVHVPSSLSPNLTLC